MTTYDSIIIGGGAAGLSAAQMLGRSRRRTLVIDAGQPRNRFATHMHGILGHDGLDPAELLTRGRAELARYDVEVRPGTVDAVHEDGGDLRVTLNAGSVRTRTVVLATGITDTLPNVPGLQERWGATVLHCPYCHGWEVRDQRLGLLVTSPMQAHLALLLRQLSDAVTVFAAVPELLDAEARAMLAARGITIAASPLAAVDGPGTSLEHARTTDGATYEIDALFAGGTPTPHDGAVTALNLDRSDTPMGSFIAIQPDGSTSHPRVWAAGNVVDPMANVPMAASAGGMAGARINAALAQWDAQRALHAATQWRDLAPVDFWEQRYGAEGAAWSGRVNATLADAVAGLTPGRSLDLGCGEGADAVHLALAGWDASGIDISTRAIARARVAATTAGVTATFAAMDLAEWHPDETYDLVTASFFHSPVSLDRAAILRRASAAVVPGGHLLLVTHAAAPPWADPDQVRDHTFLTAREEATALGLEPDDWEEVRVEDVERDATGPHDEPGHLTDGVVLLRRR